MLRNYELAVLQLQDDLIEVFKRAVKTVDNVEGMLKDECFYMENELLDLFVMVFDEYDLYEVANMIEKNEMDLLFDGSWYYLRELFKEEIE